MNIPCVKKGMYRGVTKDVTWLYVYCLLDSTTDIRPPHKPTGDVSDPASNMLERKSSVTPTLWSHILSDPKVLAGTSCSVTPHP